ncbi:MAG: zinc-dependent peptidase [Cyclobacteriaceae bacterium]|nr:zinc-dependent peptidase [Cyclobacteriaceae bacterium]
MYGILFFIIVGLGFVWFYKNRRPKPIANVFPSSWALILKERVLFYKNLDPVGQTMFEIRVQRFLAAKQITGVDTEVDDTLKLLVAASAIIPTFAFPTFNYPNVNEVLIYPNAFNKDFETGKGADGNNILGMVGNRFMKGIVIFSKPALLASFSGKANTFNVGIHEFVHLIDGLDGAIDGIPEMLINNAFALPWLVEVKKEMNKIRHNKSDINPYALTNEAEFLAVASEYFFDAPEQFERKHPELYAYMEKIFQQEAG